MQNAMPFKQLQQSSKRFIAMAMKLNRYVTYEHAHGSVCCAPSGSQVQGFGFDLELRSRKHQLKGMLTGTQPSAANIGFQHNVVTEDE